MPFLCCRGNREKPDFCTHFCQNLFKNSPFLTLTSREIAPRYPQIGVSGPHVNLECALPQKDPRYNEEKLCRMESLRANGC